MAKNITPKRALGNTGEDIACKFLKRKGFTVVARNYQKKWGEIDIVAKKGDILNFFEVKSVTVPTLDDEDKVWKYRPEENVHDFKLLRLRRTIQTYIAEIGGGPETEFGFHVLVVRMDPVRRLSRIKWINGVIL